MSAQFKPGDVVQLASGGPKMTVLGNSNSTTTPNWLQCRWFDAEGRLAHDMDFPAVALVEATANEGAGQGPG